MDAMHLKQANFTFFSKYKLAKWYIPFPRAGHIHTINLADESFSSEHEEEDTSQDHGEDSEGEEHPEQSQIFEVSLVLTEYAHSHPRIHS